MKKVFAFLVSVVTSIYSLVQKFSKPGVFLLEDFKRVINSPTADAIVNFTKTDADNRILAAARKLLPKVLVELDHAKDFDDPADVLKYFIDFYATRTPDAKKTILHSIVVLLGVRLSEMFGHKITISQSVAGSETTYQTEVKGVAF